MIVLNSPIRPNLSKLNNLLKKVNESDWYTNFGPLHNELTSRLETYLGVKNLLLTNNGTSALQVAARAIGTNSILSTPFSFVATTSAFKWQKDDVAFTDIDRKSLNICPEAIELAVEKGCIADTIVATHVYGNPCEVDLIDALSKRNNLKVIYDAAHAFGVKVDGESVLNFGDASTLSFHATKVFHTVEGGAIIFKDQSDYEYAKELINFGIRQDSSIGSMGINAKLNEYQAAVGLVNLDEIDNILDHRSELFRLYRTQLKDVVELPIWNSKATYNGAYMPIILEDELELQKVFNVLSEQNIQSRHYFRPSLNQVFTDSVNYASNNSESSALRMLCLPMHAYMSKEQVNTVVNVLKKVL